jgi:long-subunit fatty acid transport protein
MHRFAPLLCTTALAASSAWAAGITFGENGARALMSGGAFTAEADDLTALQHNPAGLTQLSGFHFGLDGEVLNHQITFVRKDPGGSTPPVNPVSNSGGPFFLPNVALGYGAQLGGRAFTVALGVYGPPGVGRYAFPEPNYNKDPADAFVETPRKFAPQRYTLIRSETSIVYPSLAAAYQLHPRLSLGGTLQYVTGRFQLRQAIYSGLTEPRRQSEEEPDFDSLVDVDLAGVGGITGVVGVLYRPLDRLSVGASVRPPFRVTARGTLKVALGENATAFGARVQPEDPKAELWLPQPLQARLGVRFLATERLGFNADFVFEGWSAMKQITLTPLDVSIQLGNDPPTKLEPFQIQKSWRDTYSVRGGVTYTFDFGLRARAGAAADAYTTIDFLHFTRVFVTGGVGYRVGPIELLAGGGFTPTQTLEVTQSEVRAGSTDAAVPGAVVGLGTHTSGGWIGTVAVRGSFGIGTGS